MIPRLCGPMGVVGWVWMVLLWTALVAVAVWAITRLFPEDTPTHHEQTDTRAADVPPQIESGRR